MAFHSSDSRGRQLGLSDSIYARHEDKFSEGMQATSTGLQYNVQTAAWVPTNQMNYHQMGGNIPAQMANYNEPYAYGGEPAQTPNHQLQPHYSPLTQMAQYQLQPTIQAPYPTDPRYYSPHSTLSPVPYSMPSMGHADYRGWANGVDQNSGRTTFLQGQNMGAQDCRLDYNQFQSAHPEYRSPSVSNTSASASPRMTGSRDATGYAAPNNHNIDNNWTSQHQNSNGIRSQSGFNPNGDRYVHQGKFRAQSQSKLEHHHLGLDPQGTKMREYPARQRITGMLNGSHQKPDPNAAFFSKMGAFTLKLVADTDKKCRQCTKNANAVNEVKANIRNRLLYKELDTPYMFLCDKVLTKAIPLRDTEVNIVECEYCLDTAVERRQARLIRDITNTTYPRNQYFHGAPKDELDIYDDWEAPQQPSRPIEAAESLDNSPPSTRSQPEQQVVDLAVATEDSFVEVFKLDEEVTDEMAATEAISSQNCLNSSDVESVLVEEESILVSSITSESAELTLVSTDTAQELESTDDSGDEISVLFVGAESMKSSAMQDEVLSEISELEPKTIESQEQPTTPIVHQPLEQSTTPIADAGAFRSTESNPSPRKGCSLYAIALLGFLVLVASASRYFLGAPVDNGLCAWDYAPLSVHPLENLTSSIPQGLLTETLTDAGFCTWDYTPPLMYPAPYLTISAPEAPVTATEPEPEPQQEPKLSKVIFDFLFEDFNTPTKFGIFVAGGLTTGAVIHYGPGLWSQFSHFRT